MRRLVQRKIPHGVVVLCLFSVVCMCSVPEGTGSCSGSGMESLPMNGGSDRYRHRNNLDPFFVTITTTAKKGFVISYMDVTATVGEEGEVDFQLVRGSTGSKTMAFQLVSNNSDFLSFQYLAYGIREEEYQKITNIINIPIGNNGSKMKLPVYTVTLIIYILLSIL